MPSTDSSKPVVLSIDPDPATRRLVVLYLTPHQFEVRNYASLEEVPPVHDPERVVLCLINAELLTDENRSGLTRLHARLSGIPYYALLDPGVNGFDSSVPIALRGQLSKPLQPHSLLSALQLPAPLESSTFPSGAIRSPNPTGSNPMTSTNRLKGFEELIQEMEMDGGMIEELTRSFLERGESYLADMEGFIESGDREVLERVAHTMKGMSGNLRFTHLMELIDQLRMIVKTGGGAKANRVIGEVRAEFDAIASDLRQWVPPSG